MSTSLWLDQLRPASWRGIPFQVLAEEEDTARQLRVHQYPYRDEVWVEDLGAGANPMVVAGFLVGDDALELREAMREAADIPGPGELVHPTLGMLDLVCLSLSISSRWDQGRVFQLAFRFVRSGDRLFPGAIADTAAILRKLCGEADTAAADSFAARMKSALGFGADSARQALRVARAVQGKATALVGDAAAALHAVGSLTGQNYTSGRAGRFFRGARVALSGSLGGVNTVAGALSRLSIARERVARAGTTFTGLLGRLG